jgi:hypothetical protein
MKRNTDNGIKGPTYFDEITKHIDNAEDLHEYEWRRQLISKSGQTKFKIKFHGEYHPEIKELIMGSESPLLVFALDPLNKEEILIFDGCIFGYDNMFWKTYSDDEIKNRQLLNFYKDIDGEELFEVFLSTFDTLSYEDNKDEIDEQGLIEIKNGEKIPFDIARRNGFSEFYISVKNKNGKISKMVEEELA